MSKLMEIVFTPKIQKEVECFGHKVVFRSLDTADNIELDVKITDTDNMSIKDLLVLALKTLSRAIVSIDGIVPDSPSEVSTFLSKQSTEVVFDLLSKYQAMVGVKSEEIKN